MAKQPSQTKVKKKEMDFTTYQQGGGQKGGDDEESEVTIENIDDKLNVISAKSKDILLIKNQILW